MTDRRTARGEACYRVRCRCGRTYLTITTQLTRAERGEATHCLKCLPRNGPRKKRGADPVKALRNEEIRRQRAAGTKLATLAERFGLCEVRILQILRGK